MITSRLETAWPLSDWKVRIIVTTISWYRLTMCRRPMISLLASRDASLITFKTGLSIRHQRFHNGNFMPQNAIPKHTFEWTNSCGECRVNVLWMSCECGVNVVLSIALSSAMHCHVPLCVSAGVSLRSCALKALPVKRWRKTPWGTRRGLDFNRLLGSHIDDIMCWKIIEIHRNIHHYECLCMFICMFMRILYTMCVYMFICIRWFCVSQEWA